MGLSLGVHVGSRITIGKKDWVDIKAIIPPNLIVLSVNGDPDIVVSDQCSTTILPDVSVFSGIGKEGSSNRLVFQAPKSIKILRK